MESFFRCCQLHDPPGTHHDLGCKVIQSIAIRFFFCLDSSFNGSAQDYHTTSRLLRGPCLGNYNTHLNVAKLFFSKITSL